MVRRQTRPCTRPAVRWTLADARKRLADVSKVEKPLKKLKAFTARKKKYVYMAARAMYILPSRSSCVKWYGNPTIELSL